MEQSIDSADQNRVRCMKPLTATQTICASIGGGRRSLEQKTITRALQFPEPLRGYILSC